MLESTDANFIIYENLKNRFNELKKYIDDENVYKKIELYTFELNELNSYIKQNNNEITDDIKKSLQSIDEALQILISIVDEYNYLEEKLNQFLCY